MKDKKDTEFIMTFLIAILLVGIFAAVIQGCITRDEKLQQDGYKKGYEKGFNDGENSIKFSS